MNRAAMCIALAACANAAPTTLTKAIARTGNATAVTTIAVDATPAACLPDAAATDVTLLDGDARTIHVCFASTECYAIDSRTAAIEAWRPATRPTASRTRHNPIQLAFTVIDGGEMVCAESRCTSWFPSLRNDLDTPAIGDVDDAQTSAVAVRRASGEVVVSRKGATLVPVMPVAPTACVDTTFVAASVLVTTNDCHNGNGHAFIIDPSNGGKIVVGDGRSLDTFGAFGVRSESRIAVVAPRAYALVLVSSTTEQVIVDLVPLQVESVSEPAFAATALKSGNWLVASETGGVGIVDRTTGTLGRTWIIPRCADLSGR